jgi:hypothetical protein
MPFGVNEQKRRQRTGNGKNQQLDRKSPPVIGCARLRRL